MAHAAKKSDASRRAARIVPVIPLPYTRGGQPKRAASPKQLQRALTPDTSDKSGRPLAHNGISDTDYGAHPTSTVQDPMTPESLPSSIVKEKVNRVSPAASLNGGGTEGDEQHAKFGAVNSHGTNGLPKPNPAIDPSSQPDNSDANDDAGSRNETEVKIVENVESFESPKSKESSRNFAPMTIPTKLPPPFYPQDSAPGPTSASSTTVQPPGGIYHPRPMANLVFGGHAESSTPSPAPVNGPDGFAYPPSEPYTYGQAQHGSDSHVITSLYPTKIHNGSFAPPVLPRPRPRPLLPHGFNPEASSFFAASEMHSRSHSQASQDVQSPARLSHHIHSASVPNGFDQAMGIDPTIALKEYLTRQFGNPDLAEYTLEISDFAESSPPIVVPVHGIIIARSPKLRSLMAQQTNEPGTKTILVKLDNKFSQSNEFVQVLRFLYGVMLPDRNMLGAQPMSQALAFAAAGCYLQLPEVTIHGLECARSWLNWDTMALALAFAVHGGLAPAWQGDSSPHESKSQPTFGDFSGEFLRTILNWLAGSIPLDFQPFTSAPQLQEIPRLPAAIETRPSVSDPRLSRIQFGEVPLDDGSRPTAVTTLLSSILFSLPYPALKYLLEHPIHYGRLSRIAEITHAVVEERESRRVKALKSKRFLPGATPEMREAMLWEERIVEIERGNSHVHDFTLAHCKVGGESSDAARNS